MITKRWRRGSNSRWRIRTDARAAARSLLERSAGLLAERTPQESLTGPLRRGDLERVGQHLAALSPPARELYRLLSRRLAELAADDLEPARAEALRRLLEDE